MLVTSMTRHDTVHWHVAVSLMIYLPWQSSSLIDLPINNQHNREAPTYFMPAPLLPQIEKCRDAMSLLDASNLHPNGTDCKGRNESLIKMKLVPVSGGDEIPLKGIRYGSKTR